MLKLVLSIHTPFVELAESKRIFLGNLYYIISFPLQCLRARLKFPSNWIIIRKGRTCVYPTLCTYRIQPPCKLRTIKGAIGLYFLQVMSFLTNLSCLELGKGLSHKFPLIPVWGLPLLSLVFIEILMPTSLRLAPRCCLPSSGN